MFYPFSKYEMNRNKKSHTPEERFFRREFFQKPGL